MLSAQQLKQLDEVTIEYQECASIDLMERAANSCAEKIQEGYDVSSRFAVFCGPGNNGGDGLAIARLLTEKGYVVTCYLLQQFKKFSSDYQINLKRLKTTDCKVIYINDDYNLSALNLKESIVIDALFGVGLSRPIEGLSHAIIVR